MTKQKIHVAFLGNQKTLERLAIKRSIDELIIVYSQEKKELAIEAIDYFSNFGITVESVCVTSYDFYNVLSLILSALNNHKFDNHQIEFSITTENYIIILAACVAAAITKASILFATEADPLQISEVWPSELVNLTLKKREILDYLENSGIPVTQKEISRNTGIRQSGISRHLRDLELAGFVERDRIARKKQVQITELGSVILHYKQIRKRRIWDTFASRAVEGVQTVG